MSPSLLLRLFETFFRRWWFYLVPVLLLGAVGALTVTGAEKKFQAVGTFNVEGTTVLATLNDGRGDTNFGWDTPATATSKRINSMLQTDQFIKDIVSKANLDNALTSGLMTIGSVRSSLTSWPNGANLVNVVATNPDPVAAQQLSGATIASFVQSVVDTQASQSIAATGFFDEQAKSNQADLAKARAALEAYLVAHPAPAFGDRPAEEDAQIENLNSDVTAAQNRYDTTLSKSQEAKLATEQTKADVGERLRLVDPPQVPTAPQGGLKDKIMSFSVFLLLGVLLCVGALVVATVLDHTIRTPAEVKDRLNLRLLAVVPDAGRATFARSDPAKARKTKAPTTPKTPKTKRTDKEPTASTRTRSSPEAPVQSIEPRTPRVASASRMAKASMRRSVPRRSGTSSWPA